jgi:DNA-binding CsgD family transcriptional regulator
MSNSGRPSKTDINERREKVRELFLKGKSPTQISTALNIHYNTALSDVQWLQARYTSLIINNTQLAKKQFARVEQLLDEVNIMKDEYWSLYAAIQEKVKANEQKYREWEEDVKKVKQELDDAQADCDASPTKENRMRLRSITKKFELINKEPKYSSYITARIDALKAILDRIDKEAKLLSLFNPQALIDKNYVSVEVLKSVMEIFKTIITDLIPEEKRRYAFERLRTKDIQNLSGEDAVDAEFREERPKKVKQLEDHTETEEDEGIDI